MNNITLDTWKKADRIYKEISNCFSIQLTRIKNTIEDGVALVYGKKSDPFRIYKEFFL